LAERGERALLCNLFARRARQAGNASEAESFSREAVAIGQKLSDRRLTALNRINLGNALRDQDRLGEAIDQYKLADTEAHEIGFVRQEAAANEVIASVLNQQGNYDLALLHASHAIGVVRDTTDTRTLARALEERAIALIGLRRFADAVVACGDGGLAIATGGIEEELFRALLVRGMRLCVEHDLAHALVGFLTRMFGTRSQTPASTSDEEVGAVAKVVDALLQMPRRLNPEALVAAISLPLSFVLRNLPPPIERAVARQLLARFVALSDASSDARLCAVTAVLLSTDTTRFTKFDLLQFAAQIASIDPSLSFRPHPDGAPHWVIALTSPPRIVCSIDQLDDSVAGNVGATVLACLLSSISPRLAAILGTENPARGELQIQFISEDDFVAYVDPKREFLGAALSDSFTVSESTDVTQSEQPPLIVILRKDFGSRWQPEATLMSDSHLVLGRVLDGATQQLLARRVPRESLRPALVQTIQRYVLRPD
jgi:tetratricopeptide (TPR) repeat protein